MTVSHASSSASGRFCAIDFGTSNSALAVCDNGVSQLVPLEGQAFNLPSAIFYPTDPSEPTLIGRAAMRAYLEQEEGRLLRALKSVLGSALMGATTEIGPGRMMQFGSIIADYLARLKARAEAHCGFTLDRVLMGRPAFFVDDDPQRDALAQQSLAQAAELAGFKTIEFEFEPVAAAFTYAQHAHGERVALVADIGGGTSDFSLIRMHDSSMHGNKQQVLASHGVHLAGTDFDRRVSVAQIMPLLGFGAINPNGLPVPGGIYHDLSTWHRVNGLYTQKSRAELQRHRDLYGGATYYTRLSRVLHDRLGHQLLTEAEQAKIVAPEHGHYTLELDDVEAGLRHDVPGNQVLEAITQDVAAIARAAQATITQAGLTPSDVTALFFTGGSSGLLALREAIAAVVPQAAVVEGERFDSVAHGLGLSALARWH